MNFINTTLFVISVTTVIYVFLVGYDGLIKLASSLFRIIVNTDNIQYSFRKRKLSADSSIPFSLVLPDCDKDASTIQMINELLELDYPEYEVIAVCNSEQSLMFDSLVKEFSMMKVNQPIKYSVPMQDVRAVYRSPFHMNLILLDKEGTTRSDAMNAGVNVSHYPLFVILGAGYSIDEDALTNLASLFARNYNIVATGGLPRVERQGWSQGLLGDLQEAEYLRTFPAGLAVSGRNRLSVALSSFGTFRKQKVIDEGGFLLGGSETEMVMRLSRKAIADTKGNDLELPSNPVLKTVPPGSIGMLIKQRIEWQSSMLFALWQNKGMLFNPKYGRAGLFDMPYYWFFNIIGPVIELLGCIVAPIAFFTGVIGFDLFLAFLIGELLFGTVVSLSAVASQQIMDSAHPSFKRLARQTVCAIVNNLGYRQLLLIFNLVGFFVPRKKYSE